MPPGENPILEGSFRDKKDADRMFNSICRQLVIEEEIFGEEVAKIAKRMTEGIFVPHKEKEIWAQIWWERFEKDTDTWVGFSESVVF